MIRYVLVTGAEGFLGRALTERLQADNIETLPIVRASTASDWNDAVCRADAIVHLAGVTQAASAVEFENGNLGTTDRLIAAIEASGHRQQPVLFTSSTKADDLTPYGRTKRASEDALSEFAERTGFPLGIFRLPHVFGPGARPDYNSIVVTICDRYARGEDIAINNPDAALRVVFVVDVISAFLRFLYAPDAGINFYDVAPIHQTTVGSAAAIIASFRDRTPSLLPPSCDPELVRALRLTFESFRERASAI